MLPSLELQADDSSFFLQFLCIAMSQYCMEGKHMLLWEERERHLAAAPRLMAASKLRAVPSRRLPLPRSCCRTRAAGAR